MAIQHAQPGELIDVSPLGSSLGSARTSTLVKSEGFEVIRLVMSAGREIPEHHTQGVIIVQCLEGRVEFRMSGNSVELSAGQMIYLEPGEPHAVRCIEDTSFLVTILFDRN